MIDKKIYQEILKKVEKNSFGENPCFYIYDLNKITGKIDLLQKNLPENVKLFYSVKANPFNKILKHMSYNPYIKGVEIASIGELKKALRVFNPKDLIFPGPGKTPYEIHKAIQEKVGYFVVESYLEALRIQQIAKEERVKSVNALIRININYKASTTMNYKSAKTQLMSGISSKLGIDENDIYSAIDKFSKLDRIVICGIHVMAGGEELNYKSLLKYFRYVFLLTKKIENYGLKVKIIDFGGGWGIDYESKNRELDIISLGKEMGVLIKEFGFGKKILIFELGKFLVAESGYYVTEIVDIKKSMGKKQIITSGGINHQKRPHEAGINHPTSIISLRKPKFYKEQISVKKEIVDIGGPLCTSLDTYCKDIYISEANVGDLVVIHLSGAYSLTFSPVNFLSHPLPKEYFIS